MSHKLARLTAGALAASFFVSVSQGLPATAQTQATISTSVSPTNQDGERLLQNGNYEQAEQSFRTALQNAPRNSAAELYAHIGLGEALLWQGELADAAKEFRKADSLQRKLPADPTLASRLQEDYSWLYQGQNNLSKAMDAAKAALAQRQAQGTQAGFATVSSLNHTAYLCDLMGQLTEAAGYYKQALALIPQGKGELFAANTQERLASVLWRLGNADEAKTLYGQGLATKLQTNAPLEKYTPHPYWDNVTHRFEPGAPNNSRRTADGKDQEIIWANGVIVAASIPQIMDADKAIKIDVAIKNDSSQPVQFLPRPPVFIITEPKFSLPKMVNPQSLASLVEKKGERKAKWIRFWGADATMPVTSTYMNQPGYWGWGYNAPPIACYGGGMPYYNPGGMTTVTTQVPDYAAQARAMERAANAIDESKSTAESIRAQSLGPTTVQPGTVTKGAFFFDATKADQSRLRIPVGDAMFEFVFPPH